MSLTKVMSFVAILISVIFYWTTSNVCRYNFAIDKKTKLLNILTEEIDPSIKKTIAKDTNIITGVLDPLGATIDKGKGMYSELLKNMSSSFKGC